jgi:hypothetical protein
MEKRLIRPEARIALAALIALAESSGISLPYTPKKKERTRTAADDDRIKKAEAKRQRRREKNQGGREEK